MLGICAAHVKFALSFDDLAIGTHLFDGASYFHDGCVGLLESPHNASSMPVRGEFYEYAVAG